MPPSFCLINEFKCCQQIMESQAPSIGAIKLCYCWPLAHRRGCSLFLQLLLWSQPLGLIKVSGQVLQVLCDVVPEVYQSHFWKWNCCMRYLSELEHVKLNRPNCPSRFIPQMLHNSPGFYSPVVSNLFSSVLSTIGFQDLESASCYMCS